MSGLTFANPPEHANQNAHENSNAPRVIEGSYIVKFKPRDGNGPPLVLPPNPLNRGKVPFGEPTSGQSRQDLEAKLGLRGNVAAIFETINAAYVKMDTSEAERLSRHPHVLRISPDRILTPTATQNNPHWALDRLDETQPVEDDTYEYQYTGFGRTIYILDSGLKLANSTVAAEFGGRAEIIWDVNDGGDGEDCNGHGTKVADAAGGATYGVAKGVKLKIVKINNGCSRDTNAGTSTWVFDWLATNASAGTIVNFSKGYTATSCADSIIDQDLEDAIAAAHDAGIIVVVAAGNDGCDTANYSPTRIPEAFVVGATGYHLFPNADGIASFSRTGTNISGFAPGRYVSLLSHDGVVDAINTSGTSFSAPYVAGIFAIACEAAGTFCDSGNTPSIYQAMRDSATLGTVTDTDGSPLTGAPSRFIGQNW